MQKDVENLSKELIVASEEQSSLVELKEKRTLLDNQERHQLKNEIIATQSELEAMRDKYVFDTRNLQGKSTCMQCLY